MMNDRPQRGQELPPGVGLCGICAHVTVIRSPRGSAFYLCRLSSVDSRFPRYPPLPVLACPGFSRAGPAPPPAG